MRFRDDYARGRRPDAAGGREPDVGGRQTVVWTWLTVAVSLPLWPVAGGYGIGWIYTAAAAGLGCGSWSRPTGCCAASAGTPR